MSVRRHVCALVLAVVFGSACEGAKQDERPPPEAAPPVVIGPVPAPPMPQLGGSDGAEAGPSPTPAPKPEPDAELDAEPEFEPPRAVAEDEPADASLPAEAARLLDEGRKRSRAGDHAGALERFEQALALAPDDGKLLCEAGWAATKLDAARAEELLLRGSVRTTAPGVRGACLYNLGQLRERAGRRDEAVVAYADSLAARPANAATRARYLALTGEPREIDDRTCPPAGRFDSVEAFCAALHDGEPDAGERDCDVLERPWPSKGKSPGEPVYVDHDHHDGPYYDRYMLLHRDDHYEVLGRLGTGVMRSCSAGYVEVERARWLDGGRLVVELHRHGEDSCGMSPQDECYEDGRPDEECDKLSSDWEPEITDDEARMLCAELGGRFRCSVPPQYYTEALDAASRPGPIPSGAALDAMLSCPPRAVVDAPVADGGE